MRPLPHACIRVQRPNRQDVETGMHATLGIAQLEPEPVDLFVDFLHRM